MDIPTTPHATGDLDVPALSARLRARLQAFDQDLLVEAVFDLMCRTIGDYSNLTAAMKQDVMAHLKYEAGIWFDVLLRGQPPTRKQLRHLEEVGRRRAHQGLPLATMLRAYHLGAREVWMQLLQFAGDDESLRDELLFKLSPYLLFHFDDVPQTISAAYLEEQIHQSRWRDALRYQLCSIVFSFPDDVTGFRQAAQALGFDAAAPRIGLAFELSLPRVDPAHLESELDRLTVMAARYLKVVSNDIVKIMHRERLVMWVPCSHGDTVVSSDRRVIECLHALLRVASEFTTVGVGLMNHGPAGWAASVEEAFVALDAGVRVQPQQRIHPYSSIAVDESVRRTDNVLRYLASLIEHLSHEPELLLTLQTFFEKHQHRKATAAALNIHPNTLNYRLERIESQLGAKLDEVGWLVKLDVALKLHRSGNFSE